MVTKKTAQEFPGMPNMRMYTNQSGTSFMGWLFLGIGIYLLGKQQGWIPEDYSIWPPLLILVGGYWILSYHLRN